MGFQFNCLVKKVRKNFKAGKSGSQLEAYVYLLIPTQSTEMEKFFDMWMPSEKFRKPETPIIVKPPIDQTGRVQVCLKDDHSDGRNYLHVMTPQLEAKLDHVVGQQVMIIVPDEEESDGNDAA